MPLCRTSAPSPVGSRQSLQVTSWTLDMPLETPPPALTRTSNWKPKSPQDGVWLCLHGVSCYLFQLHRVAKTPRKWALALLDNAAEVTIVHQSLLEQLEVKATDDFLQVETADMRVSTPDRVYKGYKNSPGLFAARVTAILHDIDPEALSYVNDIYLADDELLHHLRWVARIVVGFAEFGYKFNLKKTEIAFLSVLFLGYELSSEGKGRA
ncbi:hypothetical protein NDU88_005870 [Pleurodeles waltl]|uniref:ribonuclease H n=1 Tax=Pleurodeles waltl TaxID=8319 RepID=A0AAV7WCQ9_PLEWA|nr:hypothetical protein NDU88_005870 [Pleurodeles waltl]